MVRAIQRETHIEPSVEDSTLLARVQNGEHAAFEILVRRHAPRFYRVAYRFMSQQAESEDVVQDAFLKLWEKPESWNAEAGCAFTTWFHRVIVNGCLDRKKKKRMQPLPEERLLLDLSATQEEKLIEREQERNLEKQIASLPERQRVALNLCFYEGLSNQEAATIMGLHIKALQSLLMRAKMTLKEKLIEGA